MIKSHGRQLWGKRDFPPGEGWFSRFTSSSKLEDGPSRQVESEKEAAGGLHR